MPKALELVELPLSYLPPIEGSSPAPRSWAAREIDITVWLRRKRRNPVISAERKSRPISRLQLDGRWGADQADLDQLLSYLKSVDSSIRLADSEKVNPGLARRLVSITGPIGKLEKAFGVRLEVARLPGRPPLRVRSGPLHVPPSLLGAVLGVFGLDERPIGEPAIGMLPAGGPAATAVVPTPRQVADLYQFKTVGSCRGEVIALMQFGCGYVPAHVMKYFDDNGIRRPQLIDVGVAGATNSPSNPLTDGDKEATLDIEVAGAVAEEATLVTYFAPHTAQGWIQAISLAVHDSIRNPTVMSISWGAPELGQSNTLIWGEADMKAMSSQFEDACLLGMTVLASAGNHGSDCKVGDWKAHVNYPASDPLVVACGGTVIDDYVGHPEKETAWEYGGGGISDVYAVPVYQKKVPLPLSLSTFRPGRGLPDIAGYAYPGYDFWIGSIARLPGTSLVAPLYAAAVARNNAAVGQPTGLLHLDLYRYKSITRDIDDPISNNTSNGTNGAPGYYGRAGWDARTGLGIFRPGK